MSLIKTISYTDGLHQLANLALNGELIPVFGAGFSSGCQAASGVVPDAASARDSIRDLILASPQCPLCQHDLEEMDFFEISDLFFEYVSSESRAIYFEEYYTSVRLFQQHIDFLTKINWPYAYTINVDDGIERNSDFSIILPYHKFRRPQTSRKLLFKLHGDAGYESQYNDDEQKNIVFSQKQYLQAITDENNADIYAALLSDYSQKHLLFIGCSLQAEQDLQYIYEKSKKFQIETFRIVLRLSEPTPKEQQKLKAHGVNEIIIVEDYEKFYQDFLNTYTELLSSHRSNLYANINPTIIPFNDRDNSLRLLAGNNIFNSQENAFQKGALHILRDAVKTVRAELKAQSYVLIKGRRFSGKTYCLCSLAEYYKTKNIFYFPSSTYTDEDVIQNIFSTAQNSLFLFDSNSVTPDVYKLIVKSAVSLRERNNYMVIAANSNDNYLLSELQCNVVELYNIFSRDEIALSKKALDSFGLVRRHSKQTNIDFLYALKTEQSINIPLFLEKPIQLTPNEKAVLIALSALDKLYNSDLVALGFAQSELNNLCKKLSPLIEVVSTTKDEVTRHSATKLVHNSKVGLIELLKHFSSEDISASIQKLVRKYKPDYSRRRLYIEIILFDTINQLFSEHESSNNLIYTIYEGLQPLLNDDLHYWLQRAKSIYRTTKEITLLEDACAYAKKAYLDGNDALSAKASLTISLILCAIAEQIPEEKRIEKFEDAVNYAYWSVCSEYFYLYPAYFNTELPVGKNTHSERRIVSACKYISKNSTNTDCISKSSEILNRFEELRKKQKSL